MMIGQTVSYLRETNYIFTRNGWPSGKGIEILAALYLPNHLPLLDSKSINTFEKLST